MNTLTNKQKVTFTSIAIVSTLVLIALGWVLMLLGNFVMEVLVGFGMSESTVHALGLTTLVIQSIAPLFFTDDKKAITVNLIAASGTIMVAVLSPAIAASAIPFLVSLPFVKYTTKASVINVRSFDL